MPDWWPHALSIIEATAQRAADAAVQRATTQFRGVPTPAQTTADGLLLPTEVERAEQSTQDEEAEEENVETVAVTHFYKER
jgi:hypothetical protein